MSKKTFHTPFSVAMAVYYNDNAKDFETAVHSIYTFQTVKPTEIIIVIDGPIPQTLHDTIDNLRNEIPVIKLVRFIENRGHAAARQAGLEAASNDFIAIMDADDIAFPNRFENQLNAFTLTPDIDIIGGQITEFIGTPDNTVGERIVPLKDAEIKKYLKSRCPMNLMTVMYRKKIVQSVGGFQDWYCEEDYYLWIRMYLNGCKFANLPNRLVNVRVGKDMYARRGGWRYFKSEKGIQDYMFRKKMISFPRYIFNVMVRFGVQVAMPNKVRGFVFQKLFRK